MEMVLKGFNNYAKGKEHRILKHRSIKWPTNNVSLHHQLCYYVIMLLCYYVHMIESE